MAPVAKSRNAASHTKFVYVELGVHIITRLQLAYVWRPHAILKQALQFSFLYKRAVLTLGPDFLGLYCREASRVWRDMCVGTLRSTSSGTIAKVLHLGFQTSTPAVAAGSTDTPLNRRRPCRGSGCCRGYGIT